MNNKVRFFSVVFQTCPLFFAWESYWQISEVPSAVKTFWISIFFFFLFSFFSNLRTSEEKSKAYVRFKKKNPWPCIADTNQGIFVLMMERYENSNNNNNNKKPLSIWWITKSRHAIQKCFWDNSSKLKEFTAAAFIVCRSHTFKIWLQTSFFFLYIIGATSVTIFQLFPRKTTWIQRDRTTRCVRNVHSFLEDFLFWLFLMNPVGFRCCDCRPSERAPDFFMHSYLQQILHILLHTADRFKATLYSAYHFLFFLLWETVNIRNAKRNVAFILILISIFPQQRLNLA